MRYPWTCWQRRSSPKSEAGPGDILVVQADQIHALLSPGDSPLGHLDIQVNQRLIQENLG